MTTLEEKKIKHLEFIQGVINRHNSNSFMLKGWTITISAALYALARTVNESSIVLIALAPILLLWGLDAFYLSNERCFVDLFNSVAKGSFKLPKISIFKPKNMDELTEFEAGSIDIFSMNFKKFKIWKNNCWFYVLWSKTIFWFYFTLILITFTMMALFFLKKSNNNPSIIDVNANFKSNGLQINIQKTDTTEKSLKTIKP